METKSEYLNILKGMILVIFVSFIAVYISKFEFFLKNNISALIIAIILGVIFSHSIKGKFPKKWDIGINFCTKIILRVAIVFYGFRLTFQDIESVGLQGIIIAMLIVCLTFLFGMFLGKKVFKLDTQLCILVSAGSSICGAAAVLATKSVINAKSTNCAIAVATVVLFGTLGMFLYPYLYKLGFYSFSQEQIALYLGATLHEVAHVVAAGHTISEEVANISIIEKMLRVMLLAPFLLIISIYFTKFTKNTNKKEKNKIVIPWFAFLFIGVAILNSFSILDSNIVTSINTVDNFLLTMAMTALGIQTHISSFKNVGLKAIFLALSLFVWLMFLGIVIVSSLT